MNNCYPSGYSPATSMPQQQMGCKQKMGHELEAGDWITDPSTGEMVELICPLDGGDGGCCWNCHCKTGTRQVQIPTGMSVHCHGSRSMCYDKGRMGGPMMAMSLRPGMRLVTPLQLSHGDRIHAVREVRAGTDGVAVTTDSGRMMLSRTSKVHVLPW